MTRYTTTAQDIERAAAYSCQQKATAWLREAEKHFGRAGDTKQAAAVRAAIEKLQAADATREDDAAVYDDGLDFTGDGALAAGEQLGYRYALRLLGGEPDGE